VVRWRWALIGLLGPVAGLSLPHHYAASQGTDPHWIARDGRDWAKLSPDARTAYIEGFLAGAALSQAGAAGTDDSAALTETLQALRRDGEFRFPFAESVYASRMQDFYWWENHRPLPMWYALWEVNRTLVGRVNESGR
jgi:hypothetical protein